MRVLKIWIFTITVVLISCEGPQGEIGPAGTNGPRLSGSIIGFVSLIDSTGYISKSNSGVRISLLPGNDADTARTDSTGKWEIKNVHTGIKTIVMYKEGYFEEVREGVQFVGEGTLYLERIYMYSIPNYYVSTLGVLVNQTDTSVTIEGTVTNGSSMLVRTVLICFDTTYTVGAGEGRYLFYEHVNLSPGAGSFARYIRIDSAFKNQFNLKKGDKLFVTAFACAVNAPNVVYNKVKGKTLPAYYGNHQPGVSFGIPEFTIP